MSPSASPEPLLPHRTPAAAAAPHAAPASHTPQRILVLGATSGIAEACCRLWAARGDHLYLVARSADKLAAVAADLRTRSWLPPAPAPAIFTAVADLDDMAAHPELLGQAVATLGGVDVVLLAFGMLGDQTVAEHSARAAEQTLHTNLIAPVSLLTWLGDHCAQAHAGTLAVLSSVAGDRGRKSNYVYGASKAGLSAFTAGLRNRIDREGVRVLTIKPGPVKTAMTAGMKGSSRFAEVDAVAATIVRAIDGKPAKDGGRPTGPDVLYVPGIWRVIMTVIRLIPESVFKKLNL